MREIVRVHGRRDRGAAPTPLPAAARQGHRRFDITILYFRRRPIQRGPPGFFFSCFFLLFWATASQYDFAHPCSVCLAVAGRRGGGGVPLRRTSGQVPAGPDRAASGPAVPSARSPPARPPCTAGTKAGGSLIGCWVCRSVTAAERLSAPIGSYRLAGCCTSPSRSRGPRSRSAGVAGST